MFINFVNLLDPDKFKQCRDSDDIMENSMVRNLIFTKSKF